MKKKGEWRSLPLEERHTRAKEWISSFEGNNLVETYSKKTGLNFNNAMKELRRLGAIISSEEKAELIRWKEKRRNHRERKKKRKEARENRNLMLEFDSDDTFAFIVGYTSGGAPYGVTYEEMESSQTIKKDE